MSVVLKAENISKQYRLGTVGSGTLRDDVTRWWYKTLGKEDPLLKVGDTNDRTQMGNSDYVWALQDINFEVNQGEVLGIIGRNGAGKSTLLKILSKVTAPTTGNVKVNGRIASLLEVGTGFHPELTGKENIYLNGAILGMRKHEITRKLDEIVAFAGVERYIDTPVKRYSSGMYVRLAFAVAAHLESEILIVDEVLAVGDAEFQKKCLGKMGDISKSEGRTVLFVSHNMVSIKNLCQNSILMDNGRIGCIGDTNFVISQYFNNSKLKNADGFYEFEIHEKDLFSFISAELLNSKNERKFQFNSDEEIKIRISYNLKEDISNLSLGINILTDQLESLWPQADFDIHNNLYNLRKSGKWFSDWIISANILTPGRYHIALGAGIKIGNSIEYLHHPDPFLIEINTDGFWKKSLELFGVSSAPISQKIDVTYPSQLP